MDPFELEMKTSFLEEAQQLLDDSEQCFLALESDGGADETIDKIFRLAHSLKGTSSAVGFEDVADFTHVLESLLLKLKNKDVAISSEMISLLLICNDTLKVAVAVLRADPTASYDFSGPKGELEKMMNGESTSSKAASQVTEAVAVNADTSDRNFVQIDEDLPDIAPTAMERKVDAPKRPKAPPAAAPRAAADDTIRVNLSRLENLTDFVGELVILHSVLNQKVDDAGAIALKKTTSELGKIIKEIQNISLSLRMIPLIKTFNKIQRVVRDTSEQLGKPVAVEFAGEQTEVDKTVLEQLGDPLVHIVRNAVDHGLESKEDRMAAGKSETGHVTIQASHQGRFLVIEIKDDGRGIDHEKLMKKAIEKGIFREGDSISKEEALKLIFHPGFSTKTEVTEISGRGVGLDVVKKNVEAMQGEVKIETEIGSGSTFRIMLPLTLAIIDGMISVSGKDRFVIPVNHIQETLQPKIADLNRAANVGEILNLRGAFLPVFNLSQLMGHKTPQKPTHEMIALVVSTREGPCCVTVDDIVNQQQVVIKKLGNEFAGRSGVTGSAILGDGKPSLILDLAELVIARAQFVRKEKIPARIEKGVA